MTESEEKLTFRRIGNNDWHDSEHPFLGEWEYLIGKNLLLFFSHYVVSNSLQPYGLQHTPGFPVLHHLLEFPQIHVH